MSDVQWLHLSGDENVRTMNWCDLERSDSVLANGDECAIAIGNDPALFDGDECDICICCMCRC